MTNIKWHFRIVAFIICLFLIVPLVSLGETISYADYTVLHFSIIINDVICNENCTYFLMTYDEISNNPTIWIDTNNRIVKMTGTSIMSKWTFGDDNLFKEILNVLLSDNSKDIFVIKYFGNDFKLNADFILGDGDYEI